MAMAIVTCGDFEVSAYLHTADDPRQDEWEAALSQIATMKKRRGGDLSKMRVFAVTDGGAPNSLQRRQLFIDMFEGQAKSAAVSHVLHNALKRGIVTAISWINPSFRAFTPNNLDQALSYMDVAGHGPQIMDELKRLQASLPKITTLEQMLEHSKGSA